MSEGKCPFASRRSFLAAAGGLMAAAGTGLGAGAAAQAMGLPRLGTAGETSIEPFWGSNQAGIATPQQKHTYFAVFDLTAARRADVAGLLQTWTDAAAKMTAGEPLKAGDIDTAPERLTVTFGFGAGLFVKDGQDRYGLSSRRPAELVDLPRFNGDEYTDAQTGGDLSVQACSDDPQVAFNAVRQLARMAEGVAQLRWTQTGFLANSRANETPRNLMGFKDGTESPLKASATSPAVADKAVWAGAGAPGWMQGGSYMVVRRIRLALEHWDKMDVDFQQQVVGREKRSGAPLGGKDEFDAMNLDAADSDGNSVIADTAHIRMAAAASNGGARILRRSYSYNDGTNVTAERWPPWHQGLEYDAGLLFVSYQSDPRSSFIKIFNKMSKLDMLNQFATHTASGVFACPGGIARGGFVGQSLFA